MAQDRGQATRRSTVTKPVPTQVQEVPTWQSGWTRLKSQFTGPSGSSRLARAASWNVAGGVASRVLSFAAFFLVARALKLPEILGQLGMVTNTLLTAGVFASFGMGMTATRFISLYRHASPERAGRVAAMAQASAGTLSIVGALVMLITAPQLARIALDDATMAPVLRLATPLLVLGALQDAGQGVLAGLEAFRALARVTAITGGASAIGMVLGSFAGGLPGCLIGMTVAMAAGYAVTLLTVRAELARAGLSTGLSGWRSEVPSLWHFAFPTMLAGAVVVPVTALTGALLMHQPEIGRAHV